jgi:hypothetical protein
MPPRPGLAGHRGGGRTTAEWAALLVNLVHRTVVEEAT